MAAYAKLRPLTEPREESLDQTFHRLAYSLRNSGKTAIVQCTILVGDAPRRWALDLRRRAPVTAGGIQAGPIADPRRHGTGIASLKTGRGRRDCRNLRRVSAWRSLKPRVESST
jgi:hypothetical protein